MIHLQVYMRKGYVTIQSAAEILGISVETLRNWDKKRKLSALRDKNGYRMYKISELETFAKSTNLKRSGGKIRLIS